ncbi:MAG: hypothetical protein WBA76_21265 [Phormidesmis sp.]
MMRPNYSLSSLVKGLAIFMLLTVGISGCSFLRNPFRDRTDTDTEVVDDATINGPSDLENAATNVRITVPRGWVVVRGDRRHSADIYTSYPAQDLNAAVLSESVSVLNQFDLENNAEQYRWLIEENLDRFEGESLTGLTSLNGNPAVQYEIRGTVEGQPVVYLHTTVKGRDNYYQVVGWTTQSQYSRNKETLETVIESFRGI